MSYWDTFTLSLRSITSSKMRTFLTMLGIIIGVTAVIVIVGLGNGMERFMRDEFAKSGANQLSVMISGRGSTRSVSVEDMYDIVERHQDTLSLLTPILSREGVVKIGSETPKHTYAYGVSEDYLALKSYTVSEGRGIRYIDVRDRNDICLVGTYVNQEYFDGNALGKTLRVAGGKLRIVGVVASNEETAEEGDTDDRVYMPYSTAAKLFHTGVFNSYYISVIDQDDATAAKAAVEGELFKVFQNSDCYTVISMSEMLEMLTNIVNIVIMVLSIIAAISLVVGGIGIMNIMLVSVTERTREIGIRKALGARESVILRQFVMEAATTSAIGGTMGIAVGYLLSAIATRVVQKLSGDPLTVAPSFGSVMMAFGVSAGIGILFGWLPARKAARLNPIDALRYE